MKIILVEVKFLGKPLGFKDCFPEAFKNVSTEDFFRAVNVVSQVL